MLALAILTFRWGKLAARIGRLARPVDRDLETLYANCARELGVRHPPELLLAVADTAPFSCGVFRPRIVLGRTCVTDIRKSDLRMVLLHELAHHRRRDLAINGVQLAARAVWWVHPAMWLLERTLRRVREECCDDMVMSLCAVSGDRYGRMLVEVGRLCALETGAVDSIVVGMAQCRHSLAARLRSSPQADPTLKAEPIGSMVMEIIVPDDYRKEPIELGTLIVSVTASGHQGNQEQ